MNVWQRKLLAYLHDPPSKPFNIVEHRQVAWSLIEAAFPGISRSDADWFFDKVCDHTAAAADRAVCPKSTKLNAGWDAMAAFKHPLGGGELRFEQPIVATDAEKQVGALQPHACDWTKIPSENDHQDWARFFIHWRLWRQRCAEKHPSLAHLPADTRIPDHTIWTHCSIVSALQSCVQYRREGDECKERVFRPAFLLIQIGPVQEFIAQARSTRDLWSGSYLLSWLIAHGIKAITDEVGPDCVLFPSLRGQPLFDFLHKESLYDKLGMWEELHHAQEQILTPNLPNRFLAVVPEWQVQPLAVAAEKAMQEELQRIADRCSEWLKVEDTARPRWNQQVRQFLTVHWQTWKWEEDVGKAKKGHASLKQAYEAATRGIPDEHLDPRNYRHWSRQESGVWKSEVSNHPPVIDNPGFAWAVHYAKVDKFLAARRNTRDFEAWASGDNQRDGTVKDMLSGKEEVIGSEAWQQNLPNTKGHFFRENERLGAMNLIKRVWHRAYWEDKHCHKRTPRFDSVPAVAATPYAIKMWTDSSAAAFLHLAHNADAYFENGSDDASVFHVSEWERAIKAESKRKEGPRHEAMAALQAARDALKNLGGAPGRYVAILAMDGDSMGEWVSGAKSPKWETQLAPKAVEYFTQQGGLLAKLLEAQRHVSPSYHLQLSEALANFALYLAGPIVEAFDGQLIYAGGDDILAMLPAEKALDCARALRMAFRGDPQLHTMFDGALNIGDQKGFVGLTRDAEKLKGLRRFTPVGYPLIVPGMHADISAGIVIGHMHSPLQNLVEAARVAEKRAKKDYGKAAFAVSLFKRSGETIQWGAKWESKAIALADSFADLSGAGNPLSAKFPYALARLLRAYAIDPEFRIVRSNSFDPFAVFRAEFAHVVKQQGRDVPDMFVPLANEYLDQCENRRLDDFLGPFLTTTFIQRGGGE